MQTRTDKILTLCAAACVVVWVGVTWVVKNHMRPAMSRPQIVENIETSNTVLWITTAAKQGNPKSPVVLVEFSDFECPFCARYVQTVYPEIAQNFVATGTVEYAFRNYPMGGHKKAIRAAEAAECGLKQGRYWEMHDRLFKYQHALEERDLVKHANAIGLHIVAFEECLKGEVAHKVAADQREGFFLGLHATPTFLIGIRQADDSVRVLRKILGVQDYAIFKNTIQDVLGRI